MPAESNQRTLLPNFLFIGVAKAGTSWIFEVLREHPEVFVPIAKDIFFFDRYFDKGVDWYADFFKAARDETAVGEICHDYYLSDKAARRIHAVLPEARLLCCLREVGDKLVSSYTFDRSVERTKSMTFEQYVALPEIARQVDYAARLRPYYDLFGRERILVLFYDDLKKDPAAFTRAIFEFLGVDPAFVPRILHEKVNVAHEARIEVVAHIVYRVAQALRAIGLANLVGAVKRSAWFERLLYKPTDKRAEVPAAVLERVRARYRSDYPALAELIGKPLPDDWL